MRDTSPPAAEKDIKAAMIARNIDFFLLDAKSFSYLVLGTNSEETQPLLAKEQAWKYTRSRNCRFVIFSNSNWHYLWDLGWGNLHILTVFSSPNSEERYKQDTPNSQQLIYKRPDETVIIVTTIGHC